MIGLGGFGRYVQWVAVGVALAACGTGGEGGEGTAAARTPTTIIWHDDIQGTSPQLGFDGIGTNHPIEADPVPPSDANGANVSRVPNPLPGGGYAMRHYGVFDAGGARAQAGIYGGLTKVFNDQATRPGGIWMAQEVYFPQAVRAPAGGWLSIWDWHSLDQNGGNRWHTDPGLMVASDGSMRLQLTWGYGAMHDANGDGPTSTIAMPVGRWFDLEMHWEWTATKTGTIQVWIDGQLALEQRNVQTRLASHAVVETYMKWYGQSGASSPWLPSPSIRYTRNVRVAGARIWQQ